MSKNILIIGPSRSGKTTLSRKLNKEMGYSIISLDDIICGFQEAFPNLGIRHDYNDTKVATALAPFLIRYLKELSEGPNFYGGCRFAVEGVAIDFDLVIPRINKKKYLLIGLTYNHITSEELYSNIKNNDTEDDWTYYCTDEELKGNIEYFISSNRYLDTKFREYGIKTYDVSGDRETVLKEIVEYIKSADTGSYVKHF